jgi:hypothetical protein
MLDEIERIAAARGKATKERFAAEGITLCDNLERVIPEGNHCAGLPDTREVAQFVEHESHPDRPVELCEADCAFAAEAFNLDWPRLVARMRALEEFITTCSYGWTGPQEGEPFMSFDRDKLDALRAALEAGKESNAG